MRPETTRQENSVAASVEGGTVRMLHRYEYDTHAVCGQGLSLYNVVYGSENKPCTTVVVPGMWESSTDRVLLYL